MSKNRGQGPGAWFQDLDPSTGVPRLHDGPDGLDRLDYAVAQAGARGLKLVIPFVNNWNAFGGMDQYVAWAGKTHHDDFYTDPTIRQWYRSWVSGLLNRTNTYTGVKYKDDPTIMTWELANEPRCVSAGAYPRSDSCTTTTITRWADEMSRYVKSIDAHHLVSVGDEGFYCLPTTAAGEDLHWTDSCGEGVDTLALTALPAVDVMSFHLYPDSWGTSPQWGTTWITRHVRDAKSLGKAVMLGEFGLQDKSIRNTVYQQWTDAFWRAGGNGALYWILSDVQDDGTRYGDYDGFTVYCPSPVCTTLSNFAARMRGPAGPPPPPVADDDRAVVEFGQQATLHPLADDITYASPLVPGSLDLDPAAQGVQSTRDVPGGTFAASPDGTLTFTPAAGFSGPGSVSYVVQDRRGAVSNSATVTVTVKPDPKAAQTLFSFEDGTQGWVPGSWQGDIGTLSAGTAFATDGTHGLHAEVTGAGGWFGLTLPEPLDLTGRSTLSYDLRTAAAGTSTSVALQTGSGFTWCQSGWGWVNPGTTTTVKIDLLTQLSCAPADLADVRGLYVWISPGSFDLDAVRVS